MEDIAAKQKTTIGKPASPMGNNLFKPTTKTTSVVKFGKFVFMIKPMSINKIPTITYSKEPIINPFFKLAASFVA